MPRLDLTDADYDFIAHCLGIVAVVFLNDAALTAGDLPRSVSEQFRAQARQADDLRRRIDGRE